MYVNWTKIRRHAERIAGQPHGSKHPDVTMWANRIRKAVVKGSIPAKREGEAGDYLVTWLEVERWLRSFPGESKWTPIEPVRRTLQGTDLTTVEDVVRQAVKKELRPLLAALERLERRLSTLEASISTAGAGSYDKSGVNYAT